MTTTPNLYDFFTGPVMELTIEPEIVVTLGRSREVDDDSVGVAIRVDGELTSYVTIPTPEFVRTINMVRSLL
jgi:hypothetical protein